MTSTPSDPGHDPARARLMVINLVRLAGAAMAVFGLVILGGRLDLPKALGFVLVLAGLFEAMVLPLLLDRKWKSKD